jgi:integrase/recombinase XerD
MAKITTNLYHDTRFKKSSSATYPVRIRISHNGKVNMLSTGYDCTESEWKKMNGTRPGEDGMKQLKKLRDKVDEVNLILDKMKSYSFEILKKKFKNEDTGESLKAHFHLYMEKLAGKNIKTNHGYECALASFERFRPGMNLLDITPTLLAEYQEWMLSEGKIIKKKKLSVSRPNSLSTVSMYTRCLRTIIRAAIDAGTFPSDPTLYPFRKYQIPRHNDKKRRLTQNEIDALVQYDPDSEATKFAHDMFLFCFYCAGCNPADLCVMKYGDIVGRSFHFYRKKMQRAKGQPKKPALIKAPIHAGLQVIIDRYGQTKKSADTYIFPILDNTMDAQKQRAAIDLFIHRCNDGLARIKKQLGLPWLTLGVARCTSANLQRDKRVPLHVIQANMGHASIKQTEDYFGPVHEEETDAALNSLYESSTKTA